MYMLCRNMAKGEEAKAEIVKQLPSAQLHLVQVDVSKPADIRRFVESQAPAQCNVLVNNAGCMVPSTKDPETGLEVNFATNTFGPYFLTELLMPRFAPQARVINVTSAGMLTELLTLDFDNAEGVEPVQQYARNKRQMQVMTEAWARKYPHVRFYAPHPGWADTPAVQTSLPSFYDRMKSRLRTPTQGADCILWAAISPEVDAIPSGAFLEGPPFLLGDIYWL